MTPYYDAEGLRIFHGDARELARQLELSERVVIITDPVWPNGARAFPGIDPEPIFRSVVKALARRTSRLIVILGCDSGRAALSRAAYSLDPEAREKMRARAEDWRAQNRDRVLEVDRVRSKRTAERAKAKDPEKFAAKRRRNNLRQRELHPDRTRAREVVSGAIKRGKLVRPAACSSCGKVGPVEFDHTNGYDEPNWLVGVFVCKPCHWKAEHARRGAARKSS